MFQNDYIMRMIREMIRTLIKLLCNIDLEKTEDLQLDKEAAEKLSGLKELVDNSLVENAENEMLEGLNTENKQDFLVALLFYQYLNEKSNDFLDSCNFSREEVEDGLKTVVKLYGYEGMTEAFL
ncbi:MAG: hypothetical protein IJF03_02890 [Lachnospiraceae bacterium]|nr:hypothetical protein [Lachnospiraceae bacterium]